MAKNRGNRPPRRNRPGVGEIPPEIEALRDARTVLDPARTYRFRMPDGSIVSATGAELLETAAAAVAVADADRAGDDEALRQALARLGLGPIPPREEIAPMARARKRKRDVVNIPMAGSEETSRRVAEMFPGIEREAIRIAEHGGQCIMCGTMTRTCNGGVLHDDQGGALVVCYAICPPCNFLPEAEIAAQVRAGCDRLHAKGCN
ncbi:MAG: hypothetical protein JO252_27915 [Planctomycetaceae bacterium]|nr:hypothetical protein [Planctomycetaceae bacterium]